MGLAQRTSDYTPNQVVPRLIRCSGGYEFIPLIHLQPLFAVSFSYFQKAYIAMKWLIESRHTLECLRYSLSMLLHAAVGFKGDSVDPRGGIELWTKPQIREDLENTQKIA